MYFQSLKKMLSAINNNPETIMEMKNLFLFLTDEIIGLTVNI